MRPLLFIALCVMLAGCSSSTNPAPSPLSNVSTATPTPSPEPIDKDTARVESLIRDEEVQHQAEEYAKATYPTWNVEGVNTLAYSNKLYVVGIDISNKGQRKIVNLIARMYITPDGNIYWKVEALSPEITKLLGCY